MMFQTWFRSQAGKVRRPGRPQLQVLPLEDRVLPGDTILGLLLVWGFPWLDGKPAWQPEGSPEPSLSPVGSIQVVQANESAEISPAAWTVYSLGGSADRLTPASPLAFGGSNDAAVSHLDTPEWTVLNAVAAARASQRPRVAAEHSAVQTVQRGESLSALGHAGAAHVGFPMAAVQIAQTLPPAPSTIAHPSGTLAQGLDSELRAHQPGGTSIGRKSLDSSLIRGNAVAVDSDGNSYVTGSFTTPTGHAQLFVAALDPSCNLQHLQVYTFAGDAGGNAITLDQSNQAVYVAGWTAPDGGSASMLEAKFDLQCNFLSSSLLPQVANGPDVGNGISLTENGNINLTGRAANALGGSNILLVQFDPTGQIVFQSVVPNQPGVIGQDVGNAITVDGKGNAYVTGSVTTMDTDPGSYFLAKFDASGTLVCSVIPIQGIGPNSGNAVVLDPTEASAYVTGSLAGASTSTLFLAQFDTGTCEPVCFSNTLFGGDLDSGAGNGLAIDRGRSVLYMTGVNAPAAGPSKAFVAELTLDCQVLVGPTQYQNNTDGEGIAVDGADNAYLAGSPVSDLTSAFLVKFDVNTQFQCDRILASGIGQYRIANAIPQADSNEANQNSEPDMAVNPSDTSQSIIGTFGGGQPYFSTINGGTTWTHFADVPHGDENLGWSPSGIAYEAALGSGITVRRTPNPNDPSSWVLIPAGTYNHSVDQPWLKATQDSVSGQDLITIGMNDFSLPGGRSAAVRYSNDSGATWQTEALDRILPHPFNQDGPPVRMGFSGNRVYVAYEHWNSGSGGAFNYDVAVLRDDNLLRNPANAFRDLGDNGVFAATNKTDAFFTVTLGNNRDAGNLALAADPNNPDRVVVAYVDKIGPGQTRLEVKVSTDGGVTWFGDYKTTTLSGIPSLAIADNGVIGLMYTDFVAGRLQTHLVQSTDNFATAPLDEMFFSFQNGSPSGSGVYIGDFMEMRAVGNTFYGVLSAGNNLNNVQTPFGGLDQFQRNHQGDPSSGTFVLRNLTNTANVAFSIDPYYFTRSAI